MTAPTLDQLIHLIALATDANPARNGLELTTLSRGEVKALLTILREHERLRFRLQEFKEYTRTSERALDAALLTFGERVREACAARGSPKNIATLDIAALLKEGK